MLEIPWPWVLAIGVAALIVGALVGSMLARRRLAGHGTPPSLSQAARKPPAVIGPEPTARRRAAVVVHPLKAEGRKLRGTVEAVCRQEGWELPLWFETTVEESGFEQTRAALAAGVDVVIASGGDGTVRSVAEALAGTDVPLGLLPLGTGNLLARNLDLTLDRYEWATRVALWGQNRRIDVGRATLGSQPHAEEHVFLVMAGLGFDATVMADTRDDLKDKVGWWAYLDSGFRNLSGKPVKVDIRIDEQERLTRRVRTVLGGNCGKLPGGIDLMPDAKIDDGLLDIMSVAPRSFFGWLGVATRVIGRARHGPPVVEYFQGTSVVIDAEEQLEVQLDGDPIGAAKRLSMHIDPGALLVRVPTPEQARQMRAQMWPLGTRAEV